MAEALVAPRSISRAGPLSVLPPRNDPGASTTPLPLWAVRVWEEPTPTGEEPLEWILLTSVPTTTLVQAWERVEWYKHRWVVEEYHQCLKTGCRLEERQLQRVERIMRLLGLLSPVAVRLLQLRDLSRQEPQAPASEGFEADVLAVIAAQTGQSPTQMTMEAAWKAVAQMGGSAGSPQRWSSRLENPLEGLASRSNPS